MSYVDEVEEQRCRREWKYEMKKSDLDDGDKKSDKSRENSPRYQCKFRETPDLSRPTNKYKERDRSRENSPRYQRRFRRSPDDRSTSRYKEADSRRENSPRNQRRFRGSPEDSRLRKRYRSRENSPRYRRRSRESSEESRLRKRYRSRENSSRYRRRSRESSEDSRSRKRYMSRDSSPRYQRHSWETSEDSRPRKKYKEFRTVAIQTDITALQQSQQALETLFHHQGSVVLPVKNNVVLPVKSSVVLPVEPSPCQQKKEPDPLLLALSLNSTIPLDGETLPTLPCLTKNQKRQQNRRNTLIRILTSGMEFDEQKVLKLWKKAATSAEFKLFNSYLERLRKERDSSLGLLNPSSHQGVFLNQSRYK